MIEQQVSKYRRACDTRNVGQDAACVQGANTVNCHDLSATGFLALVMNCYGPFHVKLRALMISYVLPCLTDCLGVYLARRRTQSLHEPRAIMRQ